MKSLKWLMAVLMMATSGFAMDFRVADFGATGDGKTDDGAAIQKAVDAAVAAGAGSCVVFEQKTYRLDWRKAVPYQISLAGATNIAIADPDIPPESRGDQDIANHVAVFPVSLEMHNNVFFLLSGTVFDDARAEWTGGVRRVGGIANWVHRSARSVPAEWTRTITGMEPGLARLELRDRPNAMNTFSPSPSPPCNPV